MSDSEISSENKSQSFAERFKKKSSTFSSEALQKKDPLHEHKSISDMIQNAEQKEQKNEKLSSIDPQKKAQAELIYLVKGIDAGRNAWYYVLVERLKVQLFLKALNDDIIHLENYGKILYSAYGDEPPVYITQMLKDEYGIE